MYYLLTYFLPYIAFVQTIRTEGAGALWKGLGPALLRQSVYGTFRYGAYEPIKGRVGVGQAGQGEMNNLLRKMLAACIAGATGSFIAVPCDLVKIRMQADKTGTRYAGTLGAFSDIFRSEGVKGMWRGAGPTCSRAAVGAMTELPVYDEIKTRLLESGTMNEGFNLHVTAALAAGLFSTFWMNPFDVMKSRMMNQNGTAAISTNVSGLASTYTSQLDCFRQTIQTEGISALWKGFGPAYARIGPRVVIIFVVLEQLRMTFDN